MNPFFLGKVSDYPITPSQATIFLFENSAGLNTVRFIFIFIEKNFIKLEEFKYQLAIGINNWNVQIFNYYLYAATCYCFKTDPQIQNKSKFAEKQEIIAN